MSSDSQKLDTKALLQRAYSTLGEMQARINELERRNKEPLAIIGVGLRFPGGANDLDSFWRLLERGEDTIREVPVDRWNIDEYYDPDPDAPGKMYTRWGAFLDDIDRFDPQFFGIAPREAASMDPQQRLLLEVTREALENAGIAPGKIADTQTGVFLGIASDDYAHLIMRHLDVTDIDAYIGAGVSHSIAAGRLSYILKVHGPCVSVDTACSTSLVSVYLACQSLRLGECDLAIAGGVNLIIAPDGSISTSRNRMMSFDGRCKTFDAAADGYVRGEGCSMILIKRLSDALADKDHIHAIISGTAINQDGRSNGITAPNGLAQEAVIRAALKDADIDPGQVGYIEAHGTGTSLGDPIEIRALNTAYGPTHNQENPLYVGSVKTNIGHLEAAAGIAGLIKVVAMLKNRQIAAHLNFNTPNPLIPWDEIPVKIPTKTTPWNPSAAKQRTAGLSSFGFSGTNVHFILTEAPQREKKNTAHENPYHLLTLSARHPSSLRNLAETYQGFLADKTETNLCDICFTANTGRDHLNERLAIVAQTKDQLAEKLATWIKDGSATGVTSGTVPAGDPPEIAFLFTGQGAQYPGMAHQLYETSPIFRTSLDQCNELLRPFLDRPLLELIYPETEAKASLIDETVYTQPALFSIEYALAQMWLSWGIEPGAVSGHSIGEFVAACISGVFSLEDAIKLIAERGRLMQSLPRVGAMAAVFADEHRCQAALRAYADRVSIAAINGPDNVVISGAEESIQEILRKLNAEGIRSRRLTVSHAFHSPLMDPILSAFRKVAASVDYATPQIPLISNVTGKIETNLVTNSSYWTDHIRSTVRFADGISTLYKAGFRLFLELGPKPTLVSMGSRVVPESDVLWLASLRPGREDWQQTLESLSSAYTNGIEVDWDSFERSNPGQVVPVPPSAFNRQRYWLNFSRATSRARLSEGRKRIHPFLDHKVESPLLKEMLFESRVGIDTQPFLSGHRFYNILLLPATVYMEIGMACGTQSFNGKPFKLEAVKIEQALVLPEDGFRTVQVSVSPVTNGEAVIRVFSRSGDDTPQWTLHTTGTLRASQDTRTKPAPVAWQTIRSNCTEEISPEDYYRRAAEAGVFYGESFRGITKLQRCDGEAIAFIDLPENAVDRGQEYNIHPVLLDAALQTFGAAVPGFDVNSPPEAIFVPTEIEAYQIHHSGQTRFWAHAVLNQKPGAVLEQAISGDVQLYNDTGEIIAQIIGVHMKRIDQAVIRSLSGHNYDEWLYEIQWQPKALQPVEQSPKPGRWIIFADQLGLGETISAQLQESGHTCILVWPDEKPSARPESHRSINPDRKDDFYELIQSVEQDASSPYLGTLFLWSLDTPPVPGGKSLSAELKRLHGSALYLIQALLESQLDVSRGKLLLATQGAQALSVDQELVKVNQTPLWGLMRTTSLEYPDLNCVCFDLPPGGNHEELVKGIVDELNAEDGENQIALRSGNRYVARLTHSVPAQDDLTIIENQPFEIQLTERGTLDNLAVRPLTRQKPGSNQVEIRVLATGLNFRDVLNVLAMYPGPAGPLGNECAGIVVSVGDQVSNFKVSDEVIALVPGSFKSHVIAPVEAVYPKPEAFSFAEAVTIPITYLTAYYGLHHLAKIKSGDRILIHAAAGGVGVAAVQLAQRAGATIFGTAGSERKREFLRRLGVELVMDSRSLDFADQIMQLTNGEGVDIVLNSLADDFIPKSLSVVANHGRFLEIGKRGVWDEAQVSELNPTIQYYVYDLAQVLVDTPGFFTEVMDLLAPKFISRDLLPLPVSRFPIQRTIGAFRFMAQARHIGKIVITQVDSAFEHASAVLRPQSTYLITGGLGGLGMIVARDLAARGAKHLVLMSRRGPSQGSEQLIEELESLGATVLVAKGDVSREEDVREIVSRIDDTLPPLRGIIHAAGVLDDGALLQQTWERFATVMAPKIGGAWNLHTLTMHQSLDFFIMLSSMTSVLGSRGQSNYAAANAFLDGLAYYRNSLGLPAVSINWSAWGEVGMAAKVDRRSQQRWSDSGVSFIAPQDGLEILRKIQETDKPQVCVLPLDLDQFTDQDEYSVPPILRELAVTRQRSRPIVAMAESKEPSLPEQLARVDPSDRYETVLAHVSQQVMHVLGLDPSQPPEINRGLTEIGMDSLMAVELSNRLKRSVGTNLPNTLPYEYPTLSAITEFLLRDILTLEPDHSATPAQAIDAAQGKALSKLKQMSEDEAEDDLLKELEDSGY